MLRIHASKLEPEQLVNALSRVNSLLSVDVEVRRVTKSTRGKGKDNLSAGDFLVEENSLPGAAGITRRFADEIGLKVTNASSYDPDTSPRLRTPVVGLYSGYGTSPKSLLQLHQALERTGFSLVSFVDSRDFEEALSRLDVLVMPGGDSTEMSLSIGPQNARSIRKFVEQGGTYLGICAGAFLGITGEGGGIGPADPSFASTQETLGAVKAQLLNESSKQPKVPMWSYRDFGNVIRAYPYQGDVKFKLKKRSDLVTLGLPSTFCLRMEGPVLKVKDESDVLLVSDGSVPTTTFGVRQEGAEPLFVQFDAVVRKKVGSGQYLLSGPHIESGVAPEGIGLLGNSLFSVVAGTLSLSLSSNSQRPEPRRSSLFMASIVDQSDELSRSMQRLSQHLLVLISLISCTEASRLCGRLEELSQTLSSLSNESKELGQMTIEVIDEQQHTQRLLSSISRGSAATPVTGGFQPLVSLMSKLDQEYGSTVTTAGRAMPALTMVCLRLEKETTELISKLSKGEQVDALRETIVLIEKIAGDKGYYAPWYDGRTGPASDEPPSQGITSPLMGVRAKLRHIRNTSRAMRLASTS